jgi:hypothetical protein
MKRYGVRDKYVKDMNFRNIYNLEGGRREIRKNITKHIKKTKMQEKSKKVQCRYN